ncbi:MAG: polysaccharide deacetylase family protein [Alphaproteobacteria bacterium]|nr:polysaccharide deacetylase family protein [Alphaproteobacteria bacterium]
MTRDPSAQAQRRARLPAASPPQLLVFIDTEEEFDWQRSFSSDARAVTAMKHQWRAQTIFDRYGVKPAYLVDYPVAAQADGYQPLREFLADGRCEIGAHLHPWVTPPVEEEVGERHSFACNLPHDLERRKLVILKETIERNLGVAPTIYRAGRYGADAETRALLDELGFVIDSSVLPWTDLRRMAGPDFRRCSPDPFWFGTDDRLLEIPLTTGFLGLLHRVGADVFPWIGGTRGVRLKATAICAHARLLDRIRLSPEGVTIAEAKRLTRALVGRGEQKVFVVSYHSPSLGVGHTPYVRTRRELEQFLAWLDEYLEFFIGEIGGQPASAHDVYCAMGAAQGRMPPPLARPNESRRAAG